MTLKALITGATGMVGKGVLLECLESQDVESVLVVNRSPLGLTHPKLKEIIHKNFFDWSAVENQLTGLNAAFFCMGVSIMGMSEETYHRLTYDLTTGLARILAERNPEMTVCYVTGAGADSSEKGKIAWARVKGKTENALMKMGFKGAYMFRPGYIHPMKGVKTKVKLYSALYSVLTPIYPLLKRLLPNSLTSSDVIGRAMINAALGKHKDSKAILEIPDINRLACPQEESI